MKNIIVFILLGCGTSAAAQSMLKISLADRSVINVSVDGRYFNKGGNSVTVGDLPPGRHRVEIYETAPDNRGRAREEVIYEGKVRTNGGEVTLFVFDPNSGQTDIQDQDMNTYTANNPPPPANNMSGNNYGYNGGQNNNNYNNNNYNQNQNAGGYNGNNNNAAVASPVAMASLTADKLSSLKDKVAAKAADTQKSDLLKESLKGETYTTDQVSTMIGWLVFEETKVTFAEWAYNNTVDKENFRNLENQFSYKNSQDELDKFLQGQK